MASIVLNTLEVAKRLEAAGFSREQAETQATIISQIVDEKMATKQDLQELELRLKYDLTIRFGTMLAAAVAVLAALITFVK